MEASTVTRDSGTGRLRENRAETEAAAPGPGAVTIADPGPLGPGRLRTHHLRPEHVQRGDPGRGRRARRPRPRARLRRPGPAAGRHVGVPHRQHVRRRGLHVLRRVLAVVLRLRAVLRKGRRQLRRGQAVGVYLVAWGIFTAYMFVASLRTTGAIAMVFALLATTFLLLGIGDWTETSGIAKAGGFVGLATAAAAWYAQLRRGHELDIRPHRPAGQAAERVGHASMRRRWNRISSSCWTSRSSTRRRTSSSRRSSPTRGSTRRPRPTTRGSGPSRPRRWTGRQLGHGPQRGRPAVLQVVRGRQAQRRPTTASTATSRPATATASRSTGTARRARRATSPTRTSTATSRSSPTR